MQNQFNRKQSAHDEKPVYLKQPTLLETLQIVQDPQTLTYSTTLKAIVDKETGEEIRPEKTVKPAYVYLYFDNIKTHSNSSVVNGVSQTVNILKVCLVDKYEQLITTKNIRNRFFINGTMQKQVQYKCRGQEFTIKDNDIVDLEKCLKIVITLEQKSFYDKDGKLIEYLPVQVVGTTSDEQKLVGIKKFRLHKKNSTNTTQVYIPRSEQKTDEQEEIDRIKTQLLESSSEEQQAKKPVQKQIKINQDYDEVTKTANERYRAIKAKKQSQ